MSLIDALTAAKAAYDLASVAMQARDDAKAQSAMAELREKLWEMSTMGFAQVQTLHSLELEVQKLRMELADAQRQNKDLEAELKEQIQYQPAEIHPGVWAYTRVEDAEKPVQSRPNFCSACYGEGKKTPLRYYPSLGQRFETWQCVLNGDHTFRNRES